MGKYQVEGVPVEGIPPVFNFTIAAWEAARSGVSGKCTERHRPQTSVPSGS